MGGFWPTVDEMLFGRIDPVMDAAEMEDARRQGGELMRQKRKALGPDAVICVTIGRDENGKWMAH